MKSCAALLVVACVLSACGAGADTDGSSEPNARAQPAADPIPQAEAEPVPAGDPRIALAAKMPGTSPSDLRATPVAGMYEVVHDGEVSYVSADGQYVFTGDLYKVSTEGEFPNLSEARRRELRRTMLATLPEKDMIVFGSRKAPHTVTVFTDVDCQWCQHLHTQIADYNKLGIRVRYLAYPRTGPATESWFKAEAAWCARDRLAALTAAKRGESVPAGTCATPVAKHYEIGRRMGLTGTPGVVLESGELIPGYLPPQDLLQAVEKGASAAAPQ